MLPGSINLSAAREHYRAHHDEARGHRLAQAQTPVTRVTLRYAGAADADRLHELAALDSAPVPPGPTLVAEVDGRLRAAVALGGEEAIADPFHRGEELLALLRLRATQLF